MNSKKVSLILFFILMGILGFSGAYLVSQNALLRLLKITYNRAELGDGISWNKMVVNIFLNFTNPSLIDVDVESYNFNVYMNGKFITKLVSTEQGYVKAAGTSVVKLVVVANPVEVIANLFSKQVISGLLFDYSKVLVRMQGVVSANHRGVGMKDIPVDLSDNLQNLLYGFPKTA